MKYLGKMHIGNNQSGKGSGRRPDAKILDTSLFKTSEEVKQFNLEMGEGTHCFLCKKRVYVSTGFSLEGKTLTVGNCCKNRVYK